MSDLARRVAVPLLLLLVVALTFAPSVEGAFIWDDVSLVQHNRYIRSWQYLGRNLTRPFWDVGPTDEAEARGMAHVYYRPLVTLSFMVDHQLYGLRAAGFHLTNLLLHLLVTLGIYCLARRLLPGPLWVPATVALLFAVHPSRAEAVTWISGRCDVMMTLFALFAVVMFHRALVESRRRAFVLSGAWLCWIVALLCKETAVIVAALVPLVDLLLVSRGDQRRFRRQALWCHLPLVAGGVLFTVGRLAFEAQFFGPRHRLVFAHRIVIVLQTLGHYGRLVLDPYRPSTQVGAFSNLAAPDWGLVALGALLIVATVGGVVLLVQRKAWLAAVSLLVAVFGLAPVMNFWPMEIHVLAAERFLYMPLIGLCLLAGLGLARLSPRSTLAALVLISLVAASWAVTARKRSADYSSAVHFWTAELRTSPGNPLVQRTLAHALKQARRLDEAEAYFFRAYRDTVRLKQGLALELEALLPMLDLQLLRTSDFDEDMLRRATRFFAELVALARPDATGRAVLRDSRTELVINVGSARSRRALRSYRPQLLTTLGQLHSRLGDDRLALEALREAAALAPVKLEVARARALVLLRARALEAAQQELDRVRALGAEGPEAAEFARVLAAAAPRVQALRKLQRDDPRRHRLLAELYVVTRAPLRATRELRTLLGLIPDDREAWSMLALELAAGGELEQALEVAREARRHFGAEPGLDALEEHVRKAYASRRISASAGPR